MENIYVFLTDTLTGFSGGPSYVRNKKLWLEEHGWNVVVYDWYSTNENTSFAEFESLHDNRIIDLGFDVSWFSDRIRQRVLLKIRRQLSFCTSTPSQIVVESNSFTTATWGEYLAKEIGAQHLVFLLGENITLRNDAAFKFFDFKDKHHELYSISKQAYQLLFSRYKEIDPDNAHFWNAMSIIESQEVPFTDLDNIRQASFNICHFGRFKSYVPEMVNEICDFATKNLAQTINLIFFGLTEIPTNLMQLLSKCPNLLCYFVASQQPIPNKIFRLSDVVIAAAGCATISFKSKSLTVTMDVQSGKPLGVLGYTTIQNTYPTTAYPDSNFCLSQILSQILIEKKFIGEPPLEMEKRSRGYEFQLGCVTQPHDYYDVLQRIEVPMSKIHKLMKVMLKMGLVSIVHKIKLYLFYHRK